MPIVSDLMTFHADRVPVTATLGDAATLMVDAGISSVIVVDQGKVVGIVTERDVMRAMREHENAALPVADVMTCPVHTVTEDADFRDAYRDAARLGIRHLVVVDHKSRPVGVVTETDFRRHLGLGFFRQMSDVSALMDRSFPTLPAQATLHEALKIMERDKATCVVIVDGLKPLGIVTERDVVRLFLADQGDMQLVSLMSQPLRSVRPDTNLADAAQLMQERRIRHLLVLDDAGDLVGVLSEHGLVRLLELDFVDEVLEERIELAAANETRLKIELDLAHALAVGKDRHDILTTILDVALRFPEFTCGALYWRQPDGAYRLEVQSGIPENLRSKIRFFSAGSPQARLIEAGMLVQNGCGCAGLGCASIQGCISSETCPEELGELLVLPILVGSRPMACLKLAGNGTSKITSVTVLSMKALGSQFSVTLERLAAQEEANQLKDNLSGLFDSLKDLIVVVNTSGNVVHYNRAVTERLGYAPDRLLGCRAVDMHPESTHEQAELYCHEMMAGERNSCLLPFLCADGSSLQVESRMLSGHWNGDPVMFMISQDISERQANEERQQLAASVFDHAHEGIMITDPVGVILEVNATFTELTGYLRDEAVGNSADLLKSGHHNPEFYKQMWETIRTSGYWRGEIWNRKKSGEIIVEMLTISAVKSKVGEVTHYVGIFSDITPLKEHQKRLEQLAHFDALTQLPNRMLLSDRLHLAMAQAQRSQNTLAVCYLDLDGFKPVNDDHGHSIGDRLLVEVAQRLRQCVRAGDTAARLGGDEFVLIFSSLNDTLECDRAVTRVLNALSTPFHIAGHELFLSASIGVTLFPHDASDADALLRHADQAMYQAKQAGRNRYHLFDLETDRRTRERHDELGRIQEAIDNNEFLLYYQPKVNMREGRVLGAEALIRWQHPELGLLQPSAFLPMIEGTEMDMKIGEWVLKTAIRQLEIWKQQGMETKVSVNVSGPHLQTNGFVQFLMDLLDKHPEVSPLCLELEILETAALEDIAKVANVFNECRKLGVSFALDDFGTGYSSLTYFRRLPADLLKIDQSFVRGMLDDPDDLAIVEGVIGLTKAFDRHVIAEGVETPEHGMVLLNLGCDQAQGYGIARPMPADEFPAWAKSFVAHDLWNSVTAFRWSREDLPLLLAEFEHRRWIENLQLFLDAPEGGVGGLLPPPFDVHDCRFGRWYYGKAQSRYRQIEQFVEIEAIHNAVHRIGLQMIESKTLGEPVVGLDSLWLEMQAQTALLMDGLQTIQTEVLLSRVTVH